MCAHRSVLVAVVMACGTPNAPPRVTLPSAAARAPSYPASLHAPDLLRCPLHVETYELGEDGDGEPSAPVAAAQGFVVAFNHGSSTMTQLLVDKGVLHEPVVFGPSRLATPLLVVDHGAPFMFDREALGTDGWLDDLAAGPRGVVATVLNRSERAIVRGGRIVARFSSPGPHPMPTEQVLASGRDADVVVLRTPDIRVGVAPAKGSPLVRDPRAPAFVDVSIAAGANGFLLVGVGPQLTNLALIALDPLGVPLPSVDLPPAGDAKVTRFPRAASLGDGWVLTYWDGIGPSLVRIDGASRETSAPTELRTGDERGGQTEARIATTSSAIAVTWNVTTPWFGHGVAEEIPKRPGPRIALLTCR